MSTTVFRVVEYGGLPFIYTLRVVMPVKTHHVFINGLVSAPLQRFPLSQELSHLETELTGVTLQFVRGWT